MKVILGDICYPKSEAMIIPANTKGIVSKGVPARVVKAGLSGLTKEIRQSVSDRDIEVGQCFSTGPGRLNRRGLKRIYHAVIKRLQDDFSSIHLINKTLDNVLQEVVRDGYKTVAVCGLGIDVGNLDPKTVARITVENCNRYDERIEITIIDDNKEFIEETDFLVKEINNVSTK